MQLGAFTLCACFCFFTSEGVFFRPETALVYTRSESCFPTRRTGTVFGFLNNYIYTRGCALKRGRFESFCAISLVRALPPDVIIQTRYIRWLWLVHTRGFSYDRPLGLRPQNELPTSVDHAPPSCNIYVHTLGNIHPLMVAINSRRPRGLARC